MSNEDIKDLDRQAEISVCLRKISEHWGLAEFVDGESSLRKWLESLPDAQELREERQVVEFAEKFFEHFSGQMDESERAQFAKGLREAASNMPPSDRIGVVIEFLDAYRRLAAQDQSVGLTMAKRVCPKSKDPKPAEPESTFAEVDTAGLSMDEAALVRSIVKAAR